GDIARRRAGGLPAPARAGSLRSRRAPPGRGGADRGAGSLTAVRSPPYRRRRGGDDMTPTVHLQLGMSQATLGGNNNRVYMGRDPACGLSFGDPSLSRRHAEVFLEGGYAFIRDLGSSNGTWVNGQMVGPQPVQLMPGQTIYLGMVPLVASWQ